MLVAMVTTFVRKAVMIGFGKYAKSYFHNSGRIMQGRNGIIFFV